MIYGMWPFEKFKNWSRVLSALTHRSWLARLGLTEADARKMQDLSVRDGEFLLVFAEHVVQKGLARHLRREDQDPERALCSHLDLMGDRLYLPGKGIAVCGKPIVRAIVRYMQYRDWLSEMLETRVLMQTNFLVQGTAAQMRTIAWRMFGNNVATGSIDEISGDPHAYGSSEFSHLQFVWRDDRDYGASLPRQSVYEAEYVVRKVLLGELDGGFPFASRAEEVELPVLRCVHHLGVRFRVRGKEDAQRIAYAVLDVIFDRFGDVAEGGDDLVALRQQVDELDITLNDIPKLPWREPRSA